MTRTWTRCKCGKMTGNQDGVCESCKRCPKCGRGRSRIAMFGPDQWYCNICDNPMQATEGEGEVDA